ncbi:hypothetical protein KBY96_06315 [Cyanobium sp. ATX 6A2]|nr:hypothetical protein [Cyanobium sp. ATX 6A2]
MDEKSIADALSSLCGIDYQHQDSANRLIVGINGSDDNSYQSCGNSIYPGYEFLVEMPGHGVKSLFHFLCRAGVTKAADQGCKSDGATADSTSRISCGAPTGAVSFGWFLTNGASSLSCRGSLVVDCLVWSRL